jgi:hypothetical protein
MAAQMSIDDAIAAGAQAMTACVAKAERRDPEFSRKAEEAILAHLRVVGRCSGEELTDIARARGAVPHDDRAFGAVFKSLAHRHAIRAVGYCERKKGHGTAGGRIWGLVQ